MYFKFRRKVLCSICYTAIYVPYKEIPRCAFNKLLTVIAGGESAGPTRCRLNGITTGRNLPYIYVVNNKNNMHIIIHT
jgi:hypothetical protein